MVLSVTETLMWHSILYFSEKSLVLTPVYHNTRTTSHPSLPERGVLCEQGIPIDRQPHVILVHVRGHAYVPCAVH